MIEAVTDLSRWRLEVDDGRQVWKYLTVEEARKWPQTAYDKYWLGTLDVSKLPSRCAREIRGLMTASVHMMEYTGCT